MREQAVVEDLGLLRKAGEPGDGDALPRREKLRELVDLVLTIQEMGVGPPRIAGIGDRVARTAHDRLTGASGPNQWGSQRATAAFRVDVSIGFGTYDEAPAALHRPSSSAPTFAVTAMIGRSANSGSARSARMVSYPSMSGIMMSMKTMSMPAVSCSVAIASLPPDAPMTLIPGRASSPGSANTLRASSSTTRTVKSLEPACTSR